MTDNIVTFPGTQAPQAFRGPEAKTSDQLLNELVAAANAKGRALSAARWDRERGSRPLAMLHFDLAGPGLDYIAAQAPRLFWIGLAAAVMAAGLIQAGVWG
jgi:hypothetical protein